MSYFIRKWRLIISIGFVIDLSPTVEGEALSNRTARRDNNVLPDAKLKYSFPTPILTKDLFDRYWYHKKIRGRNYQWDDHPIFAFGVANFLSYAAHFCKYETENGSFEVVSVGCGNGTIEEDIITTYRDFFGEELNITLVDPRPELSYDFRTVNDLLEKRAHIVRNCVLLIIWPEPNGRNDGYDIDAIRKLQPCSVLTLYEITGLSGSDNFRTCLYSRDIDGRRNCYAGPRLDNYAMGEVVYREINVNPGPKEFSKRVVNIEPGWVGYRFKMVKLKRTD